MGARQPEELDFIREISPNDGMMLTIPKHYFAWGRSALSAVEAGLRTAGATEPPRTILDLPCGHGRVMRMLKAAYPNARLTACDLNRDGVDFCARVFGAAAVYSDEDPAKIDLEDRFDLIWVGSLLTHLDTPAWHRFLTFFSDHLLPGGVLVFTVNGRAIIDELEGGERTFAVRDQAELVAACRRTGFGFQNYRHSDVYGISLSRTWWVCRELDRHPELDLTMYGERAVNQRQDAVACRRRDPAG